MQKWKADKDAVMWTSDDGEWVPADVAQELYEAIEILYTLGLNDEQELIVDKALAAADGEEL